MTRKLNADYLRRIMQQDDLCEAESLLFVSTAFGVEISHPHHHEEEVIDFGNGRILIKSKNYFGWTKPGKLYCGKCWRPLIGIPRDILIGNFCRWCRLELYDSSDDYFDMQGFGVYRGKVDAITAMAVRQFTLLIQGNEQLTARGMVDGYDKDHIFSVREGFELDIPPEIIAAPPNIRAITRRDNLSKGRRSDLTPVELLAAYKEFIAANPSWELLVAACDYV
jgi:hypothetical protein